MTKHLEKCSKRLESLQATAASSRPVETLWHLRVQDAYDKDFWLDLEMRGSATLTKLDDYRDCHVRTRTSATLGAIWLECCGHLSMFTTGGWQGDEIAKSRKANAVFESGLVLRHLYDFGATSETDIKVVGFREGKATTKHPITRLARNQMPEAVCQECGQPAMWLYIEFLYEEDKDRTSFGSGQLCDDHVEEHPHEDYGEPMPLFNSPRTGMCGYEGPAEPPY